MAAALPVIALVAMGAGTALSAYSQYRQSQAQADAQDFNAEVMRANAQTAQTKAAYEESQYRDKARRVLSMQRLGYAKAGVDIGSGSPLDFYLDQVKQAEKEALAIRYGGDVEATSWLNKASGSEWGADQTRSAGLLTAGSTILKGAGSMYDTYETGQLRKKNAQKGMSDQWSRTGMDYGM
jgi:hypothetical protein